MNIVLTILIFSVPLLVALALSWHSALGSFRKSALNPMLLISAYTVLVAADFGSVAIKGYGVLGQRRINAEPLHLALLQAEHVAMLLAMLAGIATGYALSGPHIPKMKKLAKGIGSTPLLIYATLLVIYLYLLFQQTDATGTLEGTVEIKNSSSRNLPLFIVSILMLPAFTYFLVNRSYRLVVPIVIVSVIVLYFSGSRTRLLYIFVPLLFYIARVRGIALPRKAFALGLPIALSLIIVGLNLRFIVTYDRPLTAENVFFGSNYLETPDLAFAETSIAASRISSSRFESFPGSSLVGVALAPLPTGIAQFKPQAGSVEFTVAYDPTRWRTYRSAFTVGGMNEVINDYPLALRYVIIYLVGLLWALAFVRAIRSPTVHGFAFSVALYLGMYQILKADLQSAGQVIWVFVLMAGIFGLVRALAQSPTLTANSPRAQPPATAIRPSRGPGTAAESLREA